MQILTEREGGVLRLQINRPEKKNALTLAMYSEMASVFEAAEQDRAVGVVLMHGHPDVFSSGNDLEDFMNSPPAGEDAPVLRFIKTIRAASKPIVAAVSGTAADGEAALAMAKAAANKLAAKPPAALRLANTLMRQASTEATAKQVQTETASFVDQLHSPEAAEALQAFFEKRSPDFAQFS